MVDVKTKEIDFPYSCGRCGNSYREKQLAEKCCVGRVKEIDWTQVDEFELKQAHVDLLKNAVISWDDCEFGAPKIDCKRPYGNSDVEDDMGEILKLQKTPKNWDAREECWNQKTCDYLYDLHKQLQVALEIILQCQSFKCGRYVRKDHYGGKWEYSPLSSHSLKDGVSRGAD